MFCVTATVPLGSRRRCTAVFSRPAAQAVGRQASDQASCIFASSAFPLIVIILMLLLLLLRLPRHIPLHRRQRRQPSAPLSPDGQRPADARQGDSTCSCCCRRRFQYSRTDAKKRQERRCLYRIRLAPRRRASDAAGLHNQ